MSPADLDLQELALERPSSPSPARRRRPYFTRYVVPGAVLLGFIALLAAAAGERFLPRKSVTVVPVVVTRAEVQREGTPLFQAAGWVEPRPTPVNVAALTEGVVDELLVVEGQEVEAGEPVARLIDVDAKLARREAEAMRALREAELESAEADLKAARLRVENPVHLQAAQADAESLLAKTETQLAKIPFLIESAHARVEYTRQSLEGKRSAEAAIARRLIQQAESEHAAAHAELNELLQRKPRLEREANALRKKVQALSTQLELLIEESRQLEDAQAKVKAARTRCDQADIAVENAELTLERTTVRAPVSGRVLKLVAYPGSRVMGLESASNQSSSTVVALYDPKMLQVRADVRLEDVPLVTAGQRVEIETASSQEPIAGTVLLPTSTANIQKNTLEVKVAIDTPPPTIRPEMLVTATFLAPPQADSQEDESDEYDRLLVPRQLVQATEGAHFVWIVDPSGLAQRKAVQIGEAGTDELVEVIDGLSPTDKLISSGREGLSDGERVSVAHEDAAIGMEAT